MERSKNLSLIGKLFLLLATLAWGTSFVILKQTIEEVPPFYVIGIRFLVASVIIFLIFFSRIIKMTKASFLRGLILGVALGCAYLTQTLGLKYTTPGRNAFITAFYCVLCPFLFWLMYKKKPKVYNVISAILFLAGLALIAFSSKEGSGQNILLGNALTLLCSFFFAFQIIFINRFQEKLDDSMILLFLELLTVGVICMGCSLIFELPKSGISAYALNTEQFLKVLYLTLVCTLFAQAAQIIGMRYTPPNQAALILCFEAVFGAVFSIIFGEEDISAMLIAGFVVVFIATLVTELRFDPFAIIKKRKTNVDNNDKKQ